MKLYKSYLFRDKDPCIDVIRTAVQDSGMTNKQISAGSSVASATVRSWFKGPTKRPQFATIEAVARVTGHTFKCMKLIKTKHR